MKKRGKSAQYKKMSNMYKIQNVRKIYFQTLLRRQNKQEIPGQEAENIFIFKLKIRDA